MKKNLPAFNMFYGWLLCFYPHSFREEFGEEMLLDFRDTLESAGQNGAFSLIIVLLRELRDFPINLLRAHLEEKSMFRILHSQPVRTGFRGAIGFGLAFAGASAINNFFMFGLTSRIPFLNRLGTSVLDYFRRENSFSILFLILSALAALVFGILFAIFFADRPRYPRYILAGMLGWFAPNVVANVFSNAMNEHPFNVMQPFYLYGYISVLTGAFLGVIFSVAKSERREPLRLLAAMTFIFPVVTYLCMKALSCFDAVKTPWLFIVLIIMMLIYFMGVIVVALSCDKKMPWMVFVGAVVYPLVSYTPFFLPRQIIESLYFGLNFNNINSLPILGTVVLKMALQQALLGLQLGLILGILLGFLKKNTPPQIMA